MIRLAVSNLRSASGRLIAAGIAIAVSVAFIVAALLFSQAFGDTLRNQVRAQWSGADVAITADAADDPSAAEADPALDESLREAVADVDGAESAQLTESGYVSVTSASSTVTANVTNVPQAGQSQPEEGSAPSEAGEVMLNAADAETLGAGVGDSLTLSTFDGSGNRNADGPSYTVSGIVPGSSSSGLTLYLTDAGLQKAPTELMPEAVRIVAADGNERADLAATVTSALESADLSEGVSVKTVDQVVEAQVDDLSGASDFLSTVGIAFGLLSAGVAALVISNTFQVLVASRIRVLALFRAVGASRQQVRGAALVESLTLGVLGSAVGVGLGFLIGWGLTSAARAFWMPEFAHVSASWTALLVGPAVGIAVTVAAGLIPAVRASRVSPIEALRPVDVPSASRRFPWFRAILGVVLACVGVALSLYGALEQSVVFGILGCFALFVAMLVSARVFVPPFVGWLARLIGAVTGRSPAVALAGRSASSAGSRTASTTGALLIGITLVTAVVVGSASLQRTLELATAEDTPVDLVVAESGGDVESVLADSDIVEDRTTVPASTASVSVDGFSGSGDLAVTSAAEGADTPVLRSEGFDVDEGTVLLEPSALGIDAAAEDIDGKTATVSVGGEDIELTVVGSRSVPTGTALVSGADSATIAEAAGSSAEAAGNSTEAAGSEAEAAGSDRQEQTWVRIADDASTSQIEALTSELDAVGSSSDAGAALTRAQYASVFQVALTVVLGLLAAAVVIAVIGVSNTLTLSVIDRRREGALLRALGFTRRAMSRMITTESLLMAVIALVFGTVLGTFFGWVGTSSLTAGTTDPVLSVPPIQVGLIVLATIIAAVLASAIPARSMSRIAPAKGMSME